MSDIAGRWYNQHGSEMDLQVDSRGHIHGTFRSGVGFPEPGEQFEVIGSVAGELVAFSVSFGKYDSMTSWTGHVGKVDGKETLYALWHMSVGLPPGHEQQLWQGIWSGADTFERELPSEEERRVRPSHPTAVVAM
jgi:avidin family protein